MGQLNRWQPSGWDGRPPQPFKIAIPEAELEDLRERLART